MGLAAGFLRAAYEVNGAGVGDIQAIRRFCRHVAGTCTGTDDSSTRQTEKRIMPIPAVIAALGATLIDIFSPLAKEKVQRELAATPRREVAEQVATAAVEAG